jgi:pyruvate dehydrogenase E2 component (dihydrolipoamide acetyltransferase)
MAARLKLAALGHTMERGKVVEWYVSEGAEVVQGAPLFAVETDKAVVDVEAPAGGVLLRIDAPVNKEYPVGATLAWIGDSGEVLPDKMDETIAAPEAVSGEQRVTPVARRLAERHGVDADRLDGTGPGGRVTKEDVKRAIDAGTAPALERKAQSKASGEPPHDVVPLTWIRRVTAERLSAHWTCAPQVTEGVDIDMTEVRAWRTAKRDEWRAAFGIMPSLNDIVLKAVAVALEAHPTLNSAFVDGSIHRPLALVV